MVARGDFAYALDLANQLHKAAISITLYLSHAQIVREVGTLDRPVETIVAGTVV